MSLELASLTAEGYKAFTGGLNCASNSSREGNLASIVPPSGLVTELEVGPCREAEYSERTEGLPDDPAVATGEIDCGISGAVERYRGAG